MLPGYRFSFVDGRFIEPVIVRDGFYRDVNKYFPAIAVSATAIRHAINIGSDILYKPTLPKKSKERKRIARIFYRDYLLNFLRERSVAEKVRYRVNAGILSLPRKKKKMLFFNCSGWNVLTCRKACTLILRICHLIIVTRSPSDPSCDFIISDFRLIVAT